MALSSQVSFYRIYKEKAILVKTRNTDMADELMEASRHISSDSAFAKQLFENFARQINFDSGVINFCQVEEGYRLSELHSFLFHEPGAMVHNYQRTSPLDDFSPALLRNTFKSLNALDLFSIEQWHQHPLYLQHCRYFDVESALAIAGKIPGFAKKFMVLYLFNATGASFNKEERYLINRTFPYLFNIWLYRLGLICDETLTRRLLLLKRFQNSPQQFELIRLVIQNPLGSSKEYAQILGLTERTIEHLLQTIFSKLEITGYTKNKRIELFRLFQFLG